MRLDTSLKLQQQTAETGLRLPVRAETAQRVRSMLEDEVPEGFILAMEAELIHDDNVFRTESGRRGDSFFVLSPKVSFKDRIRKHILTLLYKGDYALYRHLHDQDYQDHELSAGLLLDLTKKLNVEIKAGALLGHDSVGTIGNPITGGIGDPDRYRETHISGEVTYGRRIAVVQLALKLETRPIRYTNNNQEIRDRDEDSAVATAYYNLRPKLSLLAEVGRTDIDYRNAGLFNPDSEETSYLLGLRWEATIKTTGEIKFGWQEKKPDDPTVKKYRGSTLRADILWEPKPFSKVRILALRETDEATLPGTSEYVLNDLQIGWRHGITRRLTLDTVAGFQRAEHSNNEEDDYLSLRTGLKYKLQDWLEVGGSIQHERRESTLSGSDYRDNQIMFNVVAILGAGRAKPSADFQMPGIEWFPSGYAPSLINR
ncbi:MAG: outer membrane beta-barrel protein [Gammaproteobacteria bacterium]|nr:outer membrane beta-barrel protein [Gammaproteobacteria bacterium]